MTTLPTPSSLRRYLRHGMLPQLATFEAVVRLHSATRAAEAMCIAQPTLSGHLRKLSESLGVTLFSVRGKRLVPTEAALVLLQTSREVFAALERCEAALADRRPGGRPVPRPDVAAGAPIIVLPRPAAPARPRAGGRSPSRPPSARASAGRAAPSPFMTPDGTGFMRPAMPGDSMPPTP